MVSYDQNISLIFYVKDPISGCDICLVFTLPPRVAVHCSTKADIDTNVKIHLPFLADLTLYDWAVAFVKYLGILT